MEGSLSISPRPLTDAERRRILRAHRRIPPAEETVRRLYAARDREIRDATDAGASPSDIAEALGMTRQSVYDARKRAEDE